jgi:hypothetical protein
MASTVAATTPRRRAILPAHRNAYTRSARIGRAVRRLSIPLAFVAPAFLAVLHPEQAAAQSHACSTSGATAIVVIETRFGPVLAHAWYDAAKDGCGESSDAQQGGSGDHPHGSEAVGTMSTTDAALCGGPGPIIKLKQHIDCPVIGYASGIAIEAAGERRAAGDLSGRARSVSAWRGGRNRQ